MSLATTDDRHPGASTLWPAPIMTPPLQPPDAGHLHAALGWVGLGDYAAANEELEQIAAANRAHPDVLQLRWRIYAHAGQWEACLDIARALTTMTPERPFGWIIRAHTVHGRPFHRSALGCGSRPGCSVPLPHRMASRGK